MFKSAMQIDADDTFLGTSIQFSEQEILRLEREYAAQQEQTVEDLIQSGFLDTDYEDSDTESAFESEVCSEFKEYNVCDDVSSTLSLEPDQPANRYRMELSTPSSSDCSESLSTESDESMSSNLHNAVDSVSDLPVIDEHSTASNSGAINDAEDTQNVRARTTEETEDDEIEDIETIEDIANIENMADMDTQMQNDDDDDFHGDSSVRSAMDIILREFGAIALILFLLVVVPHIVHREDETTTNSVRFHRHFQCQTRIIQRLVPVVNDRNEEKEEEREELIDEQDAIWNVGIRTTTFDYDTHTIYQCQHEIRIDDLFQSDEPYPSRMAVHLEAPRLFIAPLGAGLSGSTPMMRIFKETVSVQGRHLARNHGVTALVMSFVGIAAITAANSGLEELL